MLLLVFAVFLYYLNFLPKLCVIFHLNRKICGAISEGHTVRLYDPHNHQCIGQTEDLDLNERVDSSMIQ